MSLVSVHVGPTWVSFEGSPPQHGEGHGPPASRSTVGCKPGHDSPWDTFTETSVKGSDAINPKGWERGSPRETHHFCGSPFLVGIPAVQVTAAYARHTQAIHQGIRGKYVERTGIVRRAYAERAQYMASTRAFSSTVFLAVFSKVLTVSSRISSFLQILAFKGELYRY